MEKQNQMLTNETISRILGLKLLHGADNTLTIPTIDHEHTAIQHHSTVGHSL
jgi:hypothetical protein